MNIREHILLGREDPWEEEKIGLGSSPFTVNGRHIGLYHGVDPRLRYSASFFELSPDDPRRVRSRMHNPLFVPGEGDGFRYINGEGKPESKEVIFPTGVIIENDTLWVYSGSGDKRIVFRSTSLEWLIHELDLNIINPVA